MSRTVLWSAFFSAYFSARFDRPDEPGCQPVAPADYGETHTILPAAVGLGPQVTFEERHQRPDLDGRPLPVVSGEGEERQNRHPLFPRRQPVHGAGKRRHLSLNLS